MRRPLQMLLARHAVFRRKPADCDGIRRQVYQTRHRQVVPANHSHLRRLISCPYVSCFCGNTPDACRPLAPVAPWRLSHVTVSVIQIPS